MKTRIEVGNHDDYENYKFSTRGSKYFTCYLFSPGVRQIDEILVPDFKSRTIQRIISLYISFCSLVPWGYNFNSFNGD